MRFLHLAVHVLPYHQSLSASQVLHCPVGSFKEGRQYLAHVQHVIDADSAGIFQGHSVVADLLKVSDCARTIKEAVEKMGGLDILVNSGGVWTDAMLSEPLGEKALLEGLTMHVITVARLIEEAMPHLSKNKVCISCCVISFQVFMTS